MGEHKLDRQPSAGQPEEFQVNDQEIGKTFAIRDLTDEQLARYAANADAAAQSLIHQAMALVGQHVAAAKASAILHYEQDRRRRSITLATPGDISRLVRQ